MLRLQLSCSGLVWSSAGLYDLVLVNGVLDCPSVEYRIVVLVGKAQNGVQKSGHGCVVLGRNKIGKV
jgi:hypothetical protein